MAASDWEEIKRLAADFQKAQLSSTSHKLSDRNCIEIVNKLIELKLIEVIYTTDGKEYLTPQQLEREIRDELIVHGGRINLVDLQQILNIDLTHIESKVNEIVRNDRHFTIIQGQLLDKDYLDRTAEEINETLQESGQVAIADLAKTFDLPTEFLLSAIECRLGVCILGQLNPINRDVLFTPAFVARNISKIKGLFSAITRPTLISQLVVKHGLPEKLFFNVLQTLIESKRLSGFIQGHQEKAVYTPDIFSNTQTAYIDSFFNQNGYIEYHTLAKLGIFDGRQFLKKRFGTNKGCMHLTSCCISNMILDQVDAAIDEALVNNTWVDVKPLVPSPFTCDDLQMLLQHLLKSKSRSSAHMFCQRIVASHQFIQSCHTIFEPYMKSKATKDIKTSPAVFAELTKKEKTNLIESTGEGKQSKKDERFKKATAGGGQKGGAGRGSRESGTKKTKNKYRDRMKDDDESNANKCEIQKEISFLTAKEMYVILEKECKDCDDDEFLEEVAHFIFRPLSRKYQEVAKSIFVTSSGTSASVKRKSHQDYQERINGLINNIRLFEKGANLFEGESKNLLFKHLLKTVVADVVNIIFDIVAIENLMSLSEDDIFTNETRLKLLNKLSNEWRAPLSKLNSSINGKDLEDFFKQLTIITEPEYCDVMIKKTEKKKERQLLFNHRQALTEQLERETEPAMALHLACVILFQYHTNTLLHAPGRCVPSIISYLKNIVTPTSFELLNDYQKLVVQQLNGKFDRDDKPTSLLLAEDILKIKLLVKNMKKNNSAEE